MGVWCGSGAHRLLVCHHLHFWFDSRARWETSSPSVLCAWEWDRRLVRGPDLCSASQGTYRGEEIGGEWSGRGLNVGRSRTNREKSQDERKGKEEGRGGTRRN